MFVRTRNLFTSHCPYPIKESSQTNNFALYIFPLKIWIEIIDVYDHHFFLDKNDSLCNLPIMLVFFKKFYKTIVEINSVKTSVDFVCNTYTYT